MEEARQFPYRLKSVRVSLPIRMKKGIYILANDIVYDQLVALLNSIRANYSKDIPICIIPYDDNIDLVKKEIIKRKNVFLFEDEKIIKKWEDFAREAWQIYCEFAEKQEGNLFGRHTLNVHRKLCVFDGHFERFIFLDVDILAMGSLDSIFEQLNKKEFVVYDFQHRDPSHVYNLYSANLPRVFNQEQISSNIFCTGFFASKQGLFNKKKAWLLSLFKKGEAEILYPKSAEQSILNYMIMRSKIPVCNLAFNLPKSKVTGNSVTSTHFKEKDHILYDKGNRLTYLHYIGIHSEPFRRLCAGENLDILYREVFLYYRYLHEPEKMPNFKGKARPYKQSASILKKILRKIKLK